MSFKNLIAFSLSLIYSSLSHAHSNHPRDATVNQSSTYHVGSLPEISFPLPNSWAGPIRIPGTKNDELFFWLFGTEDSQYDDNLISMESRVPPIIPTNVLLLIPVWLNGGPGCSSLAGLAKENGPFVFPGNDSNPQPNANSWTKLGNVLYIDQPVGSGYSGGSVEATINSQVTQSFVSWLSVFYNIFPEMKSKKTYITGESYAGIYASLDTFDRNRLFTLTGIDIFRSRTSPKRSNPATSTSTFKLSPSVTVCLGTTRLPRML